MAPKAYDDEEMARQRTLSSESEQEKQSGISKRSNRISIIPSLSIGLGEILGLLSLIYFCSIASFNAGYFSVVHGNFVELFSFADLFGTNIRILQYFFGVFFLYGVLSSYVNMIGSFQGVNLSQEVRQIAERFMLKYHYSNAAYWVGYLTILAFFWVMDGIFNFFEISNFTLVMLPTIIFQGFFFYFFWVGYKFELASVKTLVVAGLFGLLIFSSNAGRAWVKSEIGSDDNLQAIVDDKGLCLERDILRNSSAGLLLYNHSMKQFEFRTKETIRTIFQGRGCL